MQKLLSDPKVIKAILHAIGFVLIGLAMKGVVAEPWAGLAMYVGGGLQGGALFNPPGTAAKIETARAEGTKMNGASPPNGYAP